MQSFLQLVAHDLYTKIGNDLSRTVLVFPNKRANLFFNEYLAGESDKPIWSPAAMSISDLFQKLSVQKGGDPIRLVCELYKVFKEETRSQETLDDFYFWGELLISDFDDVDKNMVDADKLFSNLQDLKNLMDDYEFLDKEQEEAIQQFFQNFSIEKRTELKEKFISLWDKLGTIYHRYRANLTELGIAYEGMLYRNVIEQLDTDQLKYDKYIFVGFNVLNKVESDFFRKLKDAGKALFYWDYDIFYTQQIKKHEAGEFLKRNLEEFPNELPESFFNTFKESKKIRYISASTENAQARFLPGWIKAITNDHSQITVEKEKENAVVLCNEALLLPVLHSIPQEVKNVNITMGFPLAQTPVYSFINAVMELQTNGYRSDTDRFTYEAVSAILKHPYTQQLSSHAGPLERELTQTNRFYPLPSELKHPFHPAELAFGARGRFFARCIAVDGAASVEVLKAAANHKGASVVEVLQNCVIFNDGTHASVATKEGRAKNAIYLEHGKPMLFGENKEFGLMQEGFGLKVVKLGENGITEKDILIHDAHCQDNTLQLKLALMEGPDFPIALGVIRDVDAPTYNDAVIGQIEEIKGKKKYHNFQELLMTNDTWEVK